jgi:multiple sugar transport system permease protein
LLSLVNLPPSLWVASSQTVIPSVALVESFQATPFAALVLLGGLAALPPGLYEASKIDGANAIQRFRYLTFPLIWPYIIVVVLIRSIDALKAFDAIFVLTQGGPGRASETINILLFLQAFNFYHVGYSSSMVVMLFVLVVGAALILTRVRRDPSW